MSKRCSVCSHPSVEDINRALVSGTQQLQLSRKYGLSKYALCRHAKTHLPAAIVKAQEAAEVVEGDNLLGLILQQQATAQRIAKDAERTGENRTVLLAVRELLRIIELQGKLAGRLSDAPTVNIVLTPQWVEVRTLVLGALQPYPEARAAVAEALLQLQEQEPEP